MISVDTGVYTQNPYITDDTRKNSTHTVMGPNLTVSTLNGKTKVKNSAGSPLRGGFAYNPLVAEYTRENLTIGLYAQKTPVNVGLYSKISALSKIY